MNRPPQMGSVSTRAKADFGVILLRRLRTILKGYNFLLLGINEITRYGRFDASADASSRGYGCNQAGCGLQRGVASDGIAQASDPFELAKAKELAHHYRWRASKIAPKLYGDKQSVEGKFTVDWAQVCQEAAEKY